MSDAVIAGVLALAGTWAGVIALMADHLVRNQDQDTYLAWRRSHWALFRIGYGPRGLALQKTAVRLITLTLFAASGVFALRALISL